MKLIIQISLILIAILALSYYDYAIHGEEYELMKRNRSYWKVGYLKVEGINKQSFWATNRNDTVIGIEYNNALSKDRKLELGDLISLKGKHIAGDTVSVDFIHFHDGRIWKIIISVVPVLIVGFFFFRYFKIDSKIMRFVKR